MKDDLRDELFSHYPTMTLERFKHFHKLNPHVYEEFKRLATKMRATGRKCYSAQAIIYVLRWEFDLKTTGDVFQINNDFTSIYARLLVYNHPEFSEFFEFRKMPNAGIKSQEQVRREQTKETHVHSNSQK